jgi:hypothetical protein
MDPDSIQPGLDPRFAGSVEDTDLKILPGPRKVYVDPKEEKIYKISCFEELNILFLNLEAFPVKPMSFLKEIYSFYYFTKIEIFFLEADEQIVKKKLCMLCPVLFLSLYCPSFP